MGIEKQKQLSKLLRNIADLLEDETICENLDTETVDSAFDTISEGVKKFLNVGVSYKVIERLTGRKYNAIATAAHRDGVAVKILKLFPLSWALGKFKKK